MTDVADVLETRAWKTADGDLCAPRVKVREDEATRHCLHRAADRPTALAVERERNAASL